MAVTLILIGVGCIIGAIIGGGLKLTTVLEMGKLDSLLRQFMLATFGACLVLAGLMLSDGLTLRMPTGPNSASINREEHDTAGTALESAPSSSSLSSTIAKTRQARSDAGQNSSDDGTAPSSKGSAPTSNATSVTKGVPDPNNQPTVDYSGPWTDQFDQKVAIVQTGGNVSLRWHDGNQTLVIDGQIDGRSQFYGNSDVTNRQSCNGRFQDNSSIGIVCKESPDVNNWNFRLRRAP